MSGVGTLRSALSVVFWANFFSGPCCFPVDFVSGCWPWRGILLLLKGATCCPCGCAGCYLWVHQASVFLLSFAGVVCAAFAGDSSWCVLGVWAAVFWFLGPALSVGLGLGGEAVVCLSSCSMYISASLFGVLFLFLFGWFLGVFVRAGKS
jgi:hypothetical protein